MSLPNVTVWDLPGTHRPKKKENPHGCTCKSVNAQWLDKKSKKYTVNRRSYKRHVLLFLPYMLSCAHTQCDMLFV